MSILKVTEFNIKIPKLKNESIFRAIQLSDLHKKTFGKYNKELSEKVRSLSPDVIFITGDMVSRSTKNLENFRPFIRELTGIAPVYYSLGNHETDMAAVNPELHSELMEEINQTCILLDNRTEQIVKDNLKINVSGLTVYQECYKKNGHYRNLRKITAEDVIKLLGTEPDPDTLNILLAHNPMFLGAYAEYGSDIILSGHVHGGCIKLPFIGGLLSPERKFFPEYYSGLYKMKNSSMIVSCGLGKFRLFNPSEIVMINIHS